MPNLSEMILGETARTQELIDRPATLLRRRAEQEQQDELVKSKLETDSQSRTLRTRADARAERAEGRADAAEGREAELAPVKKSIAEESLKSVQIRNVSETSAVAQTVAAPVVDQMVGFWKQYIQTGDTKMKDQAMKLIRGISKDDQLKGLIAYLPQYSELAGLNDSMLYKPDQSEEQLNQEITDMVTGLEQSKQLFDTRKQDLANKNAAHALDLQKASSEATARGTEKGRLIGRAEGIEELTSRGLELPTEEEPLSEGQQAKAQETFGRFMARDVLPDIEDNAGLLGFKKNLNKDDKFVSAVTRMPEEMYNAEEPLFSGFFKGLFDPRAAKWTDEDKNLALDNMLNSTAFAISSPFRSKLEEMRKVPLKNLRDAEQFKPKSVL